MAGGSSEDSGAAGNQERFDQEMAAETGHPAEEWPADSLAESAEQEDQQHPLDEDGLPEVIPLTPELVEEEAIRGDLMLRAFVVLLAVLLACTEIAETRTLVHVKPGQYMASHGWLPPRGPSV